MIFGARVRVALKPTVNDPQGDATLGALKSLGFESVRNVRVGKSLTLEIDAADEESARREVNEMCAKLLANPVIEAYEVDVAPAGGEFPAR